MSSGESKTLIKSKSYPDTFFLLAEYILRVQITYFFYKIIITVSLFEKKKDINKEYIIHEQRFMNPFHIRFQKAQIKRAVTSIANKFLSIYEMVISIAPILHFTRLLIIPRFYRTESKCKSAFVSHASYCA